MEFYRNLKRIKLIDNSSENQLTKFHKNYTITDTNNKIHLNTEKFSGLKTAQKKAFGFSDKLKCALQYKFPPFVKYVLRLGFHSQRTTKELKSITIFVTSTEKG
uniref:Uncharacterized protein n=1 Tax=Homalodisca liturata TaxID=320908 RepID=A0A1B6HUM6_9HEMI